MSPVVCKGGKAFFLLELAGGTDVHTVVFSDVGIGWWPVVAAAHGEVTGGDICVITTIWISPVFTLNTKI